MERLMRSLTNLNYSDENLEILRNYIQNKTLPETFSDYRKKRFQDLYKNFIYDGSDFIYKPLNLIVIRDQDREETLKEIYDDPAQGFGLGIKTFYNNVISKYLNIKRKDVVEFLTHQSPYQLTQPEKKPINRPIVATYPNQRWAIDLVDMAIYEGHNRHQKWILTGIDYFSKKVFARAMPNKKATTIRDAFIDVCSEWNTQPKVLQSDNGGEFKKEFETYCENEGINQIRTLSYTPTGNALIENYNGLLRKMIREGFVKFNNLNWIDHLQDYVDNKNNRKHSVTKQEPDTIWREGNEKKINKTDKTLLDVKTKLQEKAKRDVANNDFHEFEEGDFVRPSMASLFSEVRKTLKKSLGKLIPVKYSPEIFQIGKVLKPQGKQKDFRKYSYYLKYPNSNRFLKTESKLNDANDRVRQERKFFASDLLRVEGDEKSSISLSDAQRLNSKGVKFVKDLIKEELIDKREEENDSDSSDDSSSEEERVKKVKKKSHQKPDVIQRYDGGEINWGPDDSDSDSDSEDEKRRRRKVKVVAEPTRRSSRLSKK